MVDCGVQEVVLTATSFCENSSECHINMCKGRGGGGGGDEDDNVTQATLPWIRHSYNVTLETSLMDFYPGKAHRSIRLIW